MSVDIFSSSPLDGLESEEFKLLNLVNEYRMQNGLAPIPASKALTTVANRHVQDVAENLQITVGDSRNPHSWSWGPFDLSDSSTYPNMWEAPQRLNTGYPGIGYENFYLTTANSIDAEDALEAWKNSPGHNSVILNQNIWSDLTWNAIGVGIYEGYAALWFGEEIDPTGEPIIQGSQTGITLDIDGNGEATALTDGILAVRYLFGLTGEPLTQDAVGAGATRGSSDLLINYLNEARETMLDIDGDGEALALTDGTLFVRYLFGLTGEALISGAVAENAQRNTPDAIEAHLRSFEPGAESLQIVSESDILSVNNSILL